MNETFIDDIIQGMLPYLDNMQLEKLKEVLKNEIKNVTMNEGESENSNDKYVNRFISSKRIEGCSTKSLDYYSKTISKMFETIHKDVRHITTDDLRDYLSDYQGKNEASKITIDNIRRILSSFFSWLEDENYILKSPVRRIHKIKSTLCVKDTFSDEELERMRDSTKNIRDLAIIDLLASTGMRVGELVTLNKNSIDFIERECIVHGKGDKERTVYFDARTKIHLKMYLETRSDDLEALFVSLNNPKKRLNIGGVEIIIRKIGDKLGIKKAHPHKFRRTLATGAIDKGMPIEQVQHLLGHRRIDTTLMYAMVKESNVKAAHRKYLG